MNKNNKQQRIASVCVLGQRILNSRENDSRLRLMTDILNCVGAKWGSVGATLFPGGFLAVPHSSFNRLNAPRKAVLKALNGLSSRIATHVSHGTVVIGFDGAQPSANGDSKTTEQWVMAFSSKGVEGYARKAFPHGKEAAHYTPNVEDFNGASRLLKMRGSKALMCMCYDMFGLNTAKTAGHQRFRKIQRLSDRDTCYGRSHKSFEQLRDECAEDWANLIGDDRIQVVLSTIHGFNKPGRDTFWQRHGIATASAALNGGLAIGAAHFKECLPAWNRSTLAAYRVPKEHLRMSQHRRAHRLLPVDWFVIESQWGKALVRLYEA